ITPSRSVARECCLTATSWHLVAGHRLRHPHVPHPSHRARWRPEAEEHVKRHGVSGVHRLQGIRDAVERHVCTKTALEGMPRNDVAYATGGEREYGIFHVRRWALEERVCLEQCRLDLHDLEPAVERVHVEMARSLDEHRVACAMIRIVPAERGGHSGNRRAV